MIRLFVGLELPEEIVGRLEPMGAGVPGARWVAPENMHLTLRFIGEVNGAMAEEVAEALSTVRAPAFDLTLEGLGTFAQGLIAHTLWVGARRDPELLQLQAKVERAVVSAGLEPERRRFTPHVTLARLKDSPVDRIGDFIQRYEPFRLEPVAIEHFALFSSHLSRNGAAYQIEERYPLDGAYAALAAEYA
jgi:RNA 2',3'-cyclic 3'-phosphodiesterase